MTIPQVQALSGGLALNTPADAVLDSVIHTVPLSSHYYIPLVDYTRTLIEPQVSIGDSVLTGQPIANGLVSPSSGIISAVCDHPWPHPSKTLVPTIVVEADGQDTYCEHHAVPVDGSITEHLDRLRMLGVNGLGGAAFSSFRKILSASKYGTPELIINAVECEPGISCDDALMQSQAAEIVDACESLCGWLSITDAQFAIEDDKTVSMSAVRQQLDQRASNIQLVSMPAVYPSGAESLLVQRLKGRTLSAGEYASDAGILCLNVATVLSIHRALQGQAAIDRIVTVSTESLMTSINLQVRIGTPIAEVLNCAGSISSEIADAIEANPSRVKMGGPLSGFEDSINDAPVMASTNALVVGAVAPKELESACIRCSECATVCPVDLLPQELFSAASSDDFETTKRYSLDSCILCGCCDLVCPSNIPLTPWFRYAKGAVQQIRIDERSAALALERNHKHTARIETRAKKKAAADALRREAAAVREKSANDIKSALDRVKAKRSSR